MHQFSPTFEASKERPFRGRFLFFVCFVFSPMNPTSCNPIEPTEILRAQLGKTKRIEGKTIALAKTSPSPRAVRIRVCRSRSRTKTLNNSQRSSKNKHPRTSLSCNPHLAAYGPQTPSEASASSPPVRPPASLVSENPIGTDPRPKRMTKISRSKAKMDFRAFQDAVAHEGPLVPRECGPTSHALSPITSIRPW